MTDETALPGAGKPKPADTETTPDDRIARPANVLVGVIFPVILLIVVLVLVMLPGANVFTTCDNFTAIQLIYPLIFGALGATIGGSVRFSGPIPLFGSNWNGVVAGGVAAALLGFGMTAWIKPTTCAPRHELWLKHIVVRYNKNDPDDHVARDYVGNIDWSSPNLELVASGDSAPANELKFSRDLKVLFSGTAEFGISFEFYRKADPASFYQPVKGCLFEVKIGKPQPEADKLLFKLATDAEGSVVYLNRSFFDSLETELKKNPLQPAVDCLMGRGLLNGEGQQVEKPIQTLYVVPPSGWPIGALKGSELWFVAPAPKPQDAATSARSAEAIEGAAPTPANPTPPRPTAPAPQQTRLPAGCTPSEADRGLIDQYVQGDDLGKPQRMGLYKDWASLHCYVWPIVVSGDVTANSNQRARALQLTGYAIWNAPATTSEVAGYWQPQGDNKRDFSKNLPYLQAADYKTIFELVKSDDVSLRGAAMFFIRCLPADKFETMFRAQLDSLAALDAAQRERLGIAASFMYYNRIVAWLNEDPVAKPSAALVAGEYANGKQWITRGTLGKSANSYDAMLLYAKAIVERERNLAPDLGQATFSAMIKAVEAMQDSYPSNLRHIAQGLAIGRGGPNAQDILSSIKDVDVYPSATPLALEPQPVGSNAIFAGPDEKFPKRSVNIDSQQKAYLLLRKPDWYLVNGPGWVGWLHRPAKTG